MATRVAGIISILFPLICNGFGISQIKNDQFHLTNKNTNCDECSDTTLETTGGFADKYPRYVGTWYHVGTYRDLPEFHCIMDCQGLSDKLVSTKFLLTIIENRISNNEMNKISILIIPSNFYTKF